MIEEMTTGFLFMGPEKIQTLANAWRKQQDQDSNNTVSALEYTVLLCVVINLNFPERNVTTSCS